MKKHVNIPIFIPHLGCPNQCVFCNQKTISGVRSFDIDNVKDQIDTALSTIDPFVEIEIAFFGGSFTGIDKELMISLLKIAYKYIQKDRVKSIRCSTRPDYINDDVLDILKQYGVKTIELGLQSVNDSVLLSAKRGHTRKDAVEACKLILKNGFDLVGQMMIGLPDSTIEDEIETARFIIDSGASGVRIYPTVVFHDTELCDMAERGTYAPLSLEDAVKRSARVLEMFYVNNVEAIRIGLCSSENLSSEEKYYAGPNHPAIGELVEGELFYNRISSLISNTDYSSASSLVISVGVGNMSKAIGQSKINKNRIIREFGYKNIKFKEDSCLSGYELKIEEERKRGCT